MLTLRRPELTRDMSAYPHRRLEAAWAAATAAGLPGAMFPWQCEPDQVRTSHAQQLSPHRVVRGDHRHLGEPAHQPGWRPVMVVTVSGQAGSLVPTP